MNPIIGIIAIWGLCAVWAYGRVLAYVQREWPEIRRHRDALEGALFALGGPISLIASWLAGYYGHGMQFWPRPPSNRPFMAGDHNTVACPHCHQTTYATRYEESVDCVKCHKCDQHLRYSTGEPIRSDLGDDEPDWSEPSAADLAWAQATMPGKASGHTVGWRRWDLQESAPHTLADEATTQEFVALSDAELCDRLAQMHREIVEARNQHPYILRSVNGARWQPGKPIVGYFHDGMPRAHGAGIYAFKECPAAGQVVGKVALWGSVVEHEHGYRARYAYPLELWCPNQEIADALAAAYGCPCHVSKERDSVTVHISGGPSDAPATDFIRAMERLRTALAQSSDARIRRP